MLFHTHSWSPYHCTEICYFNKQAKHLRMFEVCQDCKAKRQVDLMPEDVDEHAESLEVS